MLAGPLHREFHNGLPERSLHMGEEGKAITCIQTQPRTRQRGFWLMCPFMCLSDVDIKVNFRISLLWFAANIQISFGGRKRNSQKLLLHSHSCHTQGRAADERLLSVSAPAEGGVSLRGMPSQTARRFLHHVWQEGSEGVGYRNGHLYMSERQIYKVPHAIQWDLQLRKQWSTGLTRTSTPEELSSQSRI